ncbi:HK97 family phage major capsid protein [Silvibacterium bohemicum]|uniref:HK97 family phage major capsid protein n=1 Tax=Silvibacterium bohemicum TaxID=1577686 RepID=A0A841JTJ2_9BACT|nr:phage major capsid protein [Silvibacterium bohemicum]MBB6144723.1 HK97 family phage major capsid protein [Silvibacterium bohemicum]
MPNLKELRESRTRLITEAQQIVLAENVTNEQRAKFDVMMSDVEQMEADIARIEKVEALEAETRSTQRPPRGNPGANVDGNEREQRDRIRASALHKYLTGADRSEMEPEERAILREQRDITTGGAATGGVLIGQLGPLVWDAQKAIGSLAGEVFKKSTPGNAAPLKISSINDSGNTLVTLTEDTSITDTDPSFGTITLQSTDTIATLITVTWQELADFDAQIVSNPSANLEAFLRNKIGLRYMRGVETYLINGNGSNFASIVAGATLGATTAAATGPVYSDFVATWENLDPAYLPNAKWAMNNKTRGYLMGLLDGFGRPFFIPNPNTGSLDSILGHEIVISQPMAAANVAGATGVLFGAYDQGYVIRDSGPLFVKRLDERFADKLATGFLAYSRLSGTSVDAGTHPVLKMVTHA